MSAAETVLRRTKKTSEDQQKTVYFIQEKHNKALKRKKKEFSVNQVKMSDKSQ